MEAVVLNIYNSTPHEYHMPYNPTNSSPEQTMSLFENYHRDALKAPVKMLWIDGWKIEYLAFNREDTAHLPPIIILGGAFQNFNSYKFWVEPLLEAGPVVLIDLPAMGSNDQIRNLVTGQLSFDLELHEIAVLLGHWVTHFNLSQVSMMGLSLGSVVATNFASLYPEKMSKLVLTGVMQQTRKSWRMLLAESLVMLEQERMESFGQAVILYLINHAKLDKTKMSPTAKRLFVAQMSSFTENERLRYHINANRLLRLESTPSPVCEILVATGEYDSFTLPFENAQFALSCPNAQFAFIKNADHVPQLQRRKETIGLFTAFLKNESLHDLDGIELQSTAQLAQIDRRSEPRVKLCMPDAVLVQQHGDQQAQAIRVVDINYFGVLLEASSEEMAIYLIDRPRDFTLQVADAAGDDLLLDCLIFERSGRYVRALFKHGDFDRAERLVALLQSDKVIA